MDGFVAGYVKRGIYETRVRGKSLVLVNPEKESRVRAARRAAKERRKVERERAGVIRREGERSVRYESVAGLALLWERYAADVGIERVDLHGAKISVVSSANPSLIGLSGIVIVDLTRTLEIVTVDNRLKIIPKISTTIRVRKRLNTVDLILPPIKRRKLFDNPQPTTECTQDNSPDQEYQDRRGDNIWKLACKRRVGFFYRQYSPQTIRAVVAAQAESIHNNPTNTTDDDADDADDDDDESSSSSSDEFDYEYELTTDPLSLFTLHGFHDFQLDPPSPPPSLSLFSLTAPSSLPFPPPPLSTIPVASLRDDPFPRFMGRGTPIDRQRRAHWADPSLLLHSPPPPPTLTLPPSPSTPEPTSPEWSSQFWQDLTLWPPPPPLRPDETPRSTDPDVPFPPWDHRITVSVPVGAGAVPADIPVHNFALG